MALTSGLSSPDGVADGFTRDVGAGGFLVETDADLSVGCPVSISLHWPDRLQQVADLELCASGVVIRVEGPLKAIRADRLEFRTRGRHSFHTPGPDTPRVCISL